MDQRFQVAGMSCGHCIRSVTRAVQGIDPDAEVAVDLGSGVVTVRGSADRGAIEAAIADAGYDVKGAAA